VLNVFFTRVPVLCLADISSSFSIKLQKQNEQQQ
jgi:hypothetical protein